MVVRLEKRAHVFERRRLQIRGLADRQPVIRMIRRKQRRRDRHRRQAVRAVLVVLPPLVQHDVALRSRISAASAPAAASPSDRTPSTAPARARWSARPPSSWCDRDWSIRSATRRLPAADGSSPCRSAPSPNIRCSKRCANPVRPGMLVLRADVIPEIHRHHRQPAVLVDDHAQAVLERVLGEGNVQYSCTTLV